ncbi:MAG: 23S rRNA (guanosine(2251)-2'-O)-methyltransferase RlmB [Oscillospiraceae bacterium]|nr:23S rRNA (guanosine(2251)-2'-O)-methyltransferase RlmB [Oscillospiraceae bacterium]
MRRDAPRREHSEKPRISTEKPRINTENKYQDEPEGLIVGRNPVLEALKSGKSIDVIYTSPNATGSIASITRIAREQGIVVKSVSDAKLSQMCGGQVHQGVIASGACAEYVSVEEILEVSVRKGTSPFIIICDEIEDPHNLGAIIRTAEAAGADGVIIPKRRSASLNATVYKTSAGAASYLPVARVANISQTIDMLKSKGVWIYGTDAAGESYTRTDLTGAVAFVIGNEGSGMGKLIRGKCDHLVSLPMNGRVNSLNASVAAGIFMYETVRQRMSAGV